MKHLIIFLSILSFSISIAQNKNDKLYQSIIDNDKESVEKLLLENANPNYIKSSGWMKASMLITAVNNQNIEIVKLLLKNKADVNWKDGFETTALMYAASKGNQEMVTLLLDNGADLYAKDGDGNTVLSAAMESKNDALIEFLKSKIKN